MKTKLEKDTREPRYIPTLIKLELDKLEYKNKDELYCIIDLIYRKQIYFKSKLQKQYGFAQIARRAFIQLIPVNNFSTAMEFLVENGLIIRFNSYTLGTVAKKYKIATEFLGGKVQVRITNKLINKKIKKSKIEAEKIKVKNLEFNKSKYHKTFDINRAAAQIAAKSKCITELRDVCHRIEYNLSDAKLSDIIECEGNYIKYRANILDKTNTSELHSILHKYMIHQMQINTIADGFLFFKRNSTNGRLDSNLTSLPSYLRQYIISDEKLFNLDIKNSQPYFLYTQLLNEQHINKAELEIYGKWVTTGVLYEKLGEMWYSKKGKEKTRLQVKTMIFRIFYSKLPSYQPYKDFFRNVFPTIMEYIDLTNKDSNSTLANIMTVKESTMVLDIMMPKLKEMDISPYTIHDSFIVTESELATVRETLMDTCMQMYGMTPELHEDALFEIGEDAEDAMYQEELELENHDYGDGFDEFIR